MENELLNKIKNLETKYKKLKFIFIVSICILSVALIGFGFSKPEVFDLIKAKGIIIVDENGKDRILIGAPIPHSNNRVRTDTSLVRKYFASKIYPENPNKYMEWYKNYRHSAYGMVILNKDGMDVLQIGDQLSDPNVGRRMFLPTGILLNNQIGLEVGGFGAHTFDDGRSGVALGLDDPGNGREALHALVLSDGTRALILQDEKGKLVLGFGKPNSNIFKTVDSISFVGAKYFDKKNNLIWEQKVNQSESLKE